MIPIAKPIIGEEEKRAVLQVLESGMLARGSKVEEFEKSFAELVGVKHAIATSNGTTALHAVLLAHGIKEGDEVITPSFSFIATANSIRMTGATPVFVDIDEKTFNINLDLIEEAITDKTKAIMVVHLYGQSCQMEKVMQIAEKHNLAVIEDACQAHGAEFQGRKVGSFGTGCFSFYATKNITTGEGGMITTNNDIIAEKIRKIIHHGSFKKYHHDSVGYNYRMTDVAAAIGVEQLKKLGLFNEKRKENAQFLSENLRDVEGIIVPEAKGLSKEHVFHQFTIRITESFPKNRDQLSEFLTESGVDNSVFYPVPIHKQKAYSEYNNLSLPVTEQIVQEVISLPVHPSLTEEDLRNIVKAISNLRGNKI